MKRLVTLPNADESASPLARLPLEACGEDDLFHDYVLGAYEPVAPALGKLRSVNLLYESFALAGVEEAGHALVDRVRRDFGRFRTVFGIKWHARTGAMAWELYFYDFIRAQADCSIAHLRQVLAPQVRVDAEEPRPLPWHMFSIELNAEHLREGASAPPVPAHVYIDMRSYALLGRSFTFENVYTFHNPRTEIDDIVHRLRSSVHFDPSRANLAALMPPPLFRCHRVCVANKSASDALYFSRVSTASMRWFMTRHEWPAPLRSLAASVGTGFDHLLWDVGVDFRGDDAGVPEVSKTGLYGSF